MRSFANRTDGFSDSIFAVMSQKAAEHNAINLSQGFPDFDGPQFIKESAKFFIDRGRNQYAPYAGVPELRAEISNVYSNWYGLDYNKDSEVTVVNGGDGMGCVVRGDGGVSAVGDVDAFGRRGGEPQRDEEAPFICIPAM